MPAPLTKTKAELCRKALQILGVLGTGQTMSAEDQAMLEEATDAAVALIERRGVGSFSPDIANDAIPLEFFLPLARIVARYAAPDYGIAGQDIAGIKLEAEDAERDLRSMVVSGRSVQPTPGSYF